MKSIVVSIDPKKPDIKLIRKAAGILRRGGIVAFPTETVYGLLVDSFNEKAIRKLYRIKKRPRSKPFTILINSFKDLSKFDVEVSANARAILKKSWPGPLTAVLNTKTEKKLGFRMPRYKAINMLLRESKLSVFAPSANISGKKECTNIEDIASDFSSKVDLIVDAGISPIGIASTVIDLTSDKLRILRKGALKIREIKI